MDFGGNPISSMLSDTGIRFKSSNLDLSVADWLFVRFTTGGGLFNRLLTLMHSHKKESSFDISFSEKARNYSTTDELYDLLKTFNENDDGL